MNCIRVRMGYITILTDLSNKNAQGKQARFRVMFQLYL